MSNGVINIPERFLIPHSIEQQKLLNAVDNAVCKLESNVNKYGTGFPGTHSVAHRYTRGENWHWECGMYTGCFWLAYELTGNEFFKEVAESHFESYRRRIDECISMDNHDVGFVFSPSCVAQYKITGDEKARIAALDAAKYFFDNSYSKKGGFIIRSFKRWDEGSGCRTMMDSLMNAPLLFWSGLETENDEYINAGLKHNYTTCDYLIREDGSSFHHYQFDPHTSMPVRGLTFQGYSDESCWSRGHSWGVYGLPIAYSYTNDEKIKDTHKSVAEFMLNHLSEDNIPYWDYDFVSGDEQPRDSSAAVISSCGFHEMSRLLPEDDNLKQIYSNASALLLEAVIDKCACNPETECEGLIQHITHALPQGAGIDECAVYGDYFYLEALLRHIKPDWKKYW